MAGSLRSVSSKSARRKKRGESEESYAKRIARLDQKRTSQAKTRKPRHPEDTVAPVSSMEAAEAALHSAPKVVERFLEAHNSDLAKAESQISALVKQLEIERAERARLQAKIALESTGATTRNVEVDARVSSRPHVEAHDAEIIDLFEQRGQFIGDSEIIEVFDVGGHDPKIVSSIEPKPTISYELSDPQGHRESDPASPPSSPLKGVSVGRGGATHRDFSGSVVVQAESESTSRNAISLAEASEMLLWVGWVERARREIPNQPLYARFGDREQRAWRDAVAGAADFVGCSDLDAVSNAIPFAFELAWTLRYALDSLPPAAPILDVCWRFMAGFMKPQPRARLGILAGSETVSSVNSKFDFVRRELMVGTLVIDRSPRS